MNDKEPKKKLAFLFGAGAEVDYGMPSGIEFAKNILFPNDDIIDRAKEKAEKIGINFLKFNMTDIQGVIKSELDMNKETIRLFFNELDSKYKEKLKAPEKETEASGNDFPYVLVYFAKQYLGKSKNHNLVKFLISMYVICKGDDYVHGFSTKVVRELESFLNDTDLLVMDYKKLLLLSRELVNDIYDDNSAGSGDEKLLKEMSKELFEKALNYQTFLSKYYENLFVSKENRRSDSKFRKIASFLFLVQAYVESQEVLKKEPERSTYYDILKSKRDSYDIHIATTNYTHFLKENGFDESAYLNGKLGEYINLDTFDILTEEDLGSNTNCVPFVFPQSTVKPLVSIDVMLRFADTYNSFSDCDMIAVLGFAFNRDDALLISMFRKLINAGRKILYFKYVSDEKEKTKLLEEETKRLECIFSDKEIVSKIKIEPLSSKSNWFDTVENSLKV